MIRRQKKTPPEAVSGLQRQITEWREQRPKPGCRIPEKYWAAATRLGRDFGVSLVSRHLKLDFQGLKRRVLGLSKAEQSSKVGFVEIQMETPKVTAAEGFVTPLIRLRDVERPWSEESTDDGERHSRCKKDEMQFGRMGDGDNIVDASQNLLPESQILYPTKKEKRLYQDALSPRCLIRNLLL